MNAIKIFFTTLVLCGSAFATDMNTSKITVVKGDGYFIQADVDRDEKLNQDEFNTYRKLQEERLIQQVKKRMENMRFSAFDKNGDTKITAAELKMANMAARQQMLQELQDREALLKSSVATPSPLLKSENK